MIDDSHTANEKDVTLMLIAIKQKGYDDINSLFYK
jgi:hypothetical protein